MKLAFVRPPSASFYNDTHIREDHQITYAAGYARSQGISLDYTVFDFPLQRDITADDVLQVAPDAIVISVRETGSCVHYALRLADRFVSEDQRVIIYGQVGRLRHHRIAGLVELIETNEQHLFAVLSMTARSTDSIPQPTLNFRPLPYVFDLNLDPSRLSRFKAALESTRGCQFKCHFCYINFRSSEVDRWVPKSNEAVLADIAVYYQRGIRNFIFMDSEFLGNHPSLHEHRSELLNHLVATYPGMTFMIYCRADTLRSFGNYHLLRKAGLYNVLIGVESFDDPDLKIMRKGQRGPSIETAISELLDHDINMTISMITFNRSTTLRSLHANLLALERLHRHPNAHGLGMPNFVFNLEAAWDPAVASARLSAQTYVRWLMFYKEQPIGQRIVVDVSLEPLMEIYRVMLYEIATQVSKMSELTFLQDDMTHWFDSIGMFIVRSMKRYLERFSVGRLSLGDVPQCVDEWFSFITYFNSKTRRGISPTPITRDEIFSGYARGHFDYESHGWDNYIPVREETIKRFLAS